MGLNVCPAATVAAPIEVVWELVQPPRFSEWADGEVSHITPDGPATVGQTFTVTSRALGRSWQAHFTVEKVNTEKHQLGMHVLFPFGMQLDQFISCAPVDANSCHVQYG